MTGKTPRRDDRLSALSERVAKGEARDEHAEEFHTESRGAWRDLAQKVEEGFARIAAAMTAHSEDNRKDFDKINARFASRDVIAAWRAKQVRYIGKIVIILAGAVGAVLTLTQLWRLFR